MKKLFALLVLASVACGTSLPEPEMPVVDTREEICHLNIAIYLLGNNRELIKKVMTGELTIADAVASIGALDEDLYQAVELWRRCEEPVVAPPPARGNQVM